MAEYNEANDLSTELKILIVQGQTLVDQTRKTVKERGLSTDLTCRMQLKTDCNEVEKYIKIITSGKGKAKDEEKLKFSILRLQTTSEGILNNRVSK